MKPITLGGIALIILGAVALVYQGFGYTREKPVLDIGRIHATEDVHHHVYLSPVLGGLGVGAGIVLLVIGAKQKNS